MTASPLTSADRHRTRSCQLAVALACITFTRRCWRWWLVAPGSLVLAPDSPQVRLESLVQTSHGPHLKLSTGSQSPWPTVVYMAFSEPLKLDLRSPADHPPVLRAVQSYVFSDC